MSSTATQEKYEGSETRHKIFDEANSPSKFINVESGGVSEQITKLNDRLTPSSQKQSPPPTVMVTLPPISPAADASNNKKPTSAKKVDRLLNIVSNNKEIQDRYVDEEKLRNILQEIEASRSSSQLQMVPTDEESKRSPEIKKKNLAQMMNDLNHLLNSKSNVAQTDVSVRFFAPNDDKKGYAEEFHSAILLARSNWFRRCWRFNFTTSSSSSSSPSNPTLLERYSFTKERNPANNKYDLGIELSEDSALQNDEENELVLPPAGKFEFCLDYDKDSLEFNELKKGIKEFNKFIYSGHCTLDERTSFVLLSLARLFEVESLKELLKSYFKEQLAKNSEFNVVQLLEIAYEYSDEFGLAEILKQCIKTINEKGRDFIANPNFKRLAGKHPKLLLKLFYENQN